MNKKSTKNKPRIIHFALLSLVTALFLGKVYAAPVNIEDVETLRDNEEKYVNSEIRVTGEVADILEASRSFVLEGGGIFDDQITVIGTSKTNPVMKVKNNDKLEVTGKLVKLTVIDIERDYGIIFDPEIKAELEDVKYYLMASKITSKR